MLNIPMRHRIRAWFYRRGFNLREACNYRLFTDAANYPELRDLEDQLVIFDVGANIGMTSVSFRDSFPNATIHAFEPIPPVFAELQRFTRGKSIHCHPIAISDEQGVREIYHDPSPYFTMNSIDQDESDSSLIASQISLKRLDDFREQAEINTIHILKIDTEGHDMNILRGAEASITSGRVRNVIVETNFTAGDRAVAFADFQDYFTSRGFKFHSIYDISHGKDGRLNYFNALFKYVG